VSSDKLTDELWPDAKGDAAASTLKTALHRLTKLLGHEDAVHVRDGKLFLDPRYCRHNVWAREQSLQEFGWAARPTGCQQR
jgi:DNA-binding SARP family transcriptional activator